MMVSGQMEGRIVIPTLRMEGIVAHMIVMAISMIAPVLSPPAKEEGLVSHMMAPSAATVCMVGGDSSVRRRTG